MDRRTKTSDGSGGASPTVVTAQHDDDDDDLMADTDEDTQIMATSALRAARQKVARAAKAKVQADFDPNLIILVRRVRVRPTLIFQGRVEGDPVVAHAGGLSPATKSQTTPQKPAEVSTWSRVKTYFRKLWSPST